MTIKATAAAAMALGVAAGLAGPARADRRVDDAAVVRSDRDYRVDDGRYHGRGPGSPGPAFRYGFDRGWREGSNEGHHDGRRSRDPRYWRESEFRHADRGYKGWMGPRRDYSSGFREGYRAGYRRAYASARPGWHGRWERYGWGSSGYGPYGPFGHREGYGSYGERDARREQEGRER